MDGTRARWASPLLERPYVVVAELPGALARKDGRGAGYAPVIQFIKDWNSLPDDRKSMLAGGLPEGTGAVTAAKIAVVVHALCDRDGHRVPEWVKDARSPTDTALVPGIDLNSPFGKRIRATAPAVCQHHRVYFSVQNLDAT